MGLSISCFQEIFTDYQVKELDLSLGILFLPNAQIIMESKLIYNLGILVYLSSAQLRL